MQKIKKIRFLMPVVFLAIVGIFSVFVMLLWNWLMPSILGLVSINFWQAAGLFILARILFGGLGFGKWRMRMGRMDRPGMNPIHEKWMQMTPEQRKEFIHRRHQFGFGPSFGKDRFHPGEPENRENENG